MLMYCYPGAEFVCIREQNKPALWRLLSYMPMYLRSCDVIELISCVVSDWVVKSKFKEACTTVEPRLSGPRLSGFLDFSDFFSGPNLVMNIY